MAAGEYFSWHVNMIKNFTTDDGPLTVLGSMSGMVRRPPLQTAGDILFSLILFSMFSAAAISAAFFF